MEGIPSLLYEISLPDGAAGGKLPWEPRLSPAKAEDSSRDSLYETLSRLKSRSHKKQLITVWSTGRGWRR
jgi:hypothetical protein